MKIVANLYDIKTDVPVTIATGKSRRAKSWKTKEVMWSDLVGRLSKTVRTGESYEEYLIMPSANQGDVKDVGGFVGGALKDGRRSMDTLAFRSVLTLDMDHIDTSVDSVYSSMLLFLGGTELVVYSTHSHHPKKPRLRLVVPLSRPVSGREYQALGRKIAELVGIEYFDDSTYEPVRLMYWPSTASDGEFVFRHEGGDILDVESILGMYDDWSDVTQWPLSKRASHSVIRDAKRQEDPLTKVGIVGSFCRSYSITEAIGKFLPDVYKPTSARDRWTYHDGTGYGGLVVYEDKFAYSHHESDPIGGQLCNAFDMVRLHLYEGMDSELREGTPPNRKPSYIAMSDMAREDSQVKQQMGQERLEGVTETFDFVDSEPEDSVDTDWMEKLTFNRRGDIEDTINNALIVLEHDPRVKGKLVYDEFANRAIVMDQVPWTEQASHDWSDMDDSGVRHFLESSYGISTLYKIEDAKNLVFDRNSYHPVRKYLKSLKWDGVERIPTIFTDYLGAEDTLYTRESAIVHMTASVARVMSPGVKYDTMVTLVGAQGIGKSTFIATLGKDWYSDSLDTVKGKEGAELIQGVWHMEMGELNATRKSDRDMVKAFLSRTEDIYRIAYGKHTTRFPRQTVFWGSTNDLTFLRDPTGERRYLPVQCGVGAPKLSIWDDLPDHLDQIWAEAYHLYESGQSIILSDTAEIEAFEIREEFKEDRPIKGLIAEYLERDYPERWEDMSLSERRAFLRGDEDIFGQYGELTYKKDTVCVLEIWEELLGNQRGRLRHVDSMEINDALRSVEGWYESHPIRFNKYYGRQRGFRRIKTKDEVDTALEQE